MIYSLHASDSGYTLTIEGDLDLYSSYNLKEDLRNIYNQNPHNITIDLTGLNYIDSAGIGALIEIKKYASHHHKHYIIENTPQDILKLFRSMRIDAILPLK